MKPNHKVAARLAAAASRRLRHDSLHDFIIVAAWVDRKGSIVSCRVNRSICGRARGLHAECNALGANVKTDTLYIARFNARILRSGGAKASAGAPCAACANLVRNIPNVFYTDREGRWQRFTDENIGGYVRRCR